MTARHMWEVDPSIAQELVAHLLSKWATENDVIGTVHTVNENFIGVIALSVGIPKSFGDGAVPFDWLVQKVCLYLKQIEAHWDKTHKFIFKENPHVVVSLAGSGLRVLNFYAEMYD